MDVVDSIRAVATKPVTVEGVTDGSMENVPVEPVVIATVRKISKEEADRLAKLPKPESKPEPQKVGDQ
jgi:hypothetical protein